ncbi:MAG: sulfatase-like hydrolase/transferase, partial [Myxococcota bacterium]
MLETRPIAMLAQAGLALFLTGASLSCAPEERPPNVLLVTVDTLRADYLGAYGFPANTSPNVDRLAQQGVLFERAIAASTL